MRQLNKFWLKNKHLQLLCFKLDHLSAPLDPPVPLPLVSLASIASSSHIDLLRAPHPLPTASSSSSLSSFWSFNSPYYCSSSSTTRLSFFQLILQIQLTFIIGPVLQLCLLVHFPFWNASHNSCSSCISFIWLLLHQKLSSGILQFLSQLPQ